MVVGEDASYPMRQIRRSADKCRDWLNVRGVAEVLLAKVFTSAENNPGVATARDAGLMVILYLCPPSSRFLR
jgi:hypothetical protein